MRNKTTDSELLTSYRQELYTIGYVKNTILTKIRNLIVFKEFTRKGYKEITETDLHYFIVHLQNKELHSSTIQHYYSSIEQFFVYLQREQVITRNPCNYYELQLIKQPKTAREIVSEEEVHELYKNTVTPNEKMILHLCYGCGLRAKELERINSEAIVLPQQFIKVVKGKNNQHRIVPIPQTLVVDFIHYVSYREQQKANTNALLLNKKGNRLKAYTARTLLQDILKRTSITKVITLHSLRHSIATHLLANGMKAESVQQFLGHKQLETTETYTRIRKYQLKQLK